MGKDYRWGTTNQTSSKIGVSNTLMGGKKGYQKRGGVLGQAPARTFKWGKI